VLFDQTFPQKCNSQILANHAHDCRDVTTGFRGLHIKK